MGWSDAKLAWSTGTASKSHEKESMSIMSPLLFTFEFHSFVIGVFGVRVTIDRKEQTQVTREKIDKNVKIMRWRLGRADSDVI
jgi:hypothetical protein